MTATLSNSFSGTLTNVGQATITVPATDPNPGNNSGAATSTVSPAANLSVSKTNSTSSLVAGQTTTYSLVVGNLGPANLTNAVVRDPASTGLNCTGLSCPPRRGGHLSRTARAEHRQPAGHGRRHSQHTGQWR